MLRYYWLLIFLLLLNPTFAQDQGFVGPLLNINKSSKIFKNYNLKSNVEFRQRMFEWSETESAFNNSQQRASFQTVLQSDRINDFNHGFGAMYRLNYQSANQFRLIQQISFINKIKDYNIGHRFRLDETWRENEDFIIRMRYRFSSQIALRGQSLDIGEFYFKPCIEYLGIIESGYSTEIRFLTMIGKKLKSESKIEFGIDYRRNVNNFTRNTTWISLQLYLN